VYRPTPVCEHPDDAFLTGAWLFDSSRIPQWMQAQLPATILTRSVKASAKLTQPPMTSQKHIQQQQQQPKLQQVKPVSTGKTGTQKSSSSFAKVIRPTPVYEHPDTAFLSGAWLFDPSRTPLWMQREVPKMATALVIRSRQLAKALPICRAQRVRATSPRSKAPCLPKRLAFGATPYAVITCGSVKARHAHPDDGFDSGAWLFDVTCAPSWLALELAKTCRKQLQPVFHVQKQKTNHMQFAGVKLASGRKLGV